MFGKAISVRDSANGKGKKRELLQSRPMTALHWKPRLMEDIDAAQSES